MVDKLVRRAQMMLGSVDGVYNHTIAQQPGGVAGRHGELRPGHPRSLERIAELIDTVLQSLHVDRHGRLDSR